MSVAEQAAASVLRMVPSVRTLPSSQPFQSMTAGTVGIEPAAIVVICRLLQGHHKQLRNANAMVSPRARHGLYETMQRVHPDMPCVGKKFSRQCRAHGTDHHRFVFYMHALGIRIAFPPVPPEHRMGHTMCRAIHA